MIKKLFTLGLVLAAFAGSAQQQLKTSSIHKKTFNNNVHWTARTQATVTDTLLPSSIADSACGATPTYYGWDQVAPYDSGYIFGTGIFPSAGANVTEIAQKYVVTGSVSVTDVLVASAVATGTTTTTKVKIYSNSATTNKPNTTALGTSVALAMSGYNQAGLTAYHFATPVAIAASVGSFYASVVLPAFGGTDHDTLAILTTQQGCSSIDSLSLLKISGGWYYTRTLFGGQSGDLDLWIFPVVTMTTVGIDKVTKGDLSLYAASPNPTNSNININFSLEKSSTIEIEVFDIAGKIVKTSKNNNAIAGKNAISIDVTNLEAGSYMYSINANGNKMFSKFVVTK